MLRRRPIARIVAGGVPGITGIMMDLDLHCANCGRISGAGEIYCVGCGKRLPRTDLGGEAPGRDGEAGWGPKQVALGLLLFLTTLILAVFIAGGVGGLYPAQSRALETWAGVNVVAVGVALIVWFMGARRAARPWRALGLARPRTSAAVTGLLAAAALGGSILATFLYRAAVDLLGLEALRPPGVDGAILFSGAAVVLTFQAVAVVTPVSEEIMFRGFALRGLLPAIGPGPAVVASALVFSVLHLDPKVMIPIFFTGLAFGWLYVRTGSVWPGVAAHAGQNALALLAARGL